MRVVVYEDNPEYLAIVDSLRAEFPQHQFSLCQQAGKAYEMLLLDGEGLISDFFGPTEGGQIEDLYCEEYIKLFESNETFAVWNDCVRKGFTRGDPDLDYFSQQYYLEGIRADHQRGQDDFFKENRGYGGVLLLKSQALEIPSVLVTDVHRHSRQKTGSPINGMFILAPLMAKKLFTAEQLNDYSRDQGPRLISSTGYDKPGKDNPECWRLAVQKLEQQLVA